MSPLLIHYVKDTLLLSDISKVILSIESLRHYIISYRANTLYNANTRAERNRIYSYLWGGKFVSLLPL